MACNLVTVAVDILDVAVVSPLVRHVEGGRDGAPVGVKSPPKEVFVELLVQIVDSIVEG